jgi:two-component system cell cycle response regulator CtrA
MRILLVEDDTSVCGAIDLISKVESIELTTVGLGAEGIAVGNRHPFDLIVIDLGLPDVGGLDVLRVLRDAGVKTPVMILTGTDGIPQKVKAFATGADEYLTKPFHREEFVARLRAIARRDQGSQRKVIKCGDLCIDLDTKMAEISGTRVALTTKEFQLLVFLASRPGFTLSKEMILDHLYAGRDEPQIKIVDVFICKLRKKLADISGGDNFIETVWGRGYMLAAPRAPLQLAS